MVILDEYVEFLIKHDLTQDQLLFLLLLYYNRVDLIKKYKQTFPNDEGTMISKYLINKLEEKGFIRRSEEGLFLEEKFTNVFVNERESVNEIYDLYPAFALSDKGVNIPLKSMDKRIFGEIYIGKIQGSSKEHKEVIKDITYGIDNDLLRMGINKFLVSEHWKSIRTERFRNNMQTGSGSESLYEDF